MPPLHTLRLVQVPARGGTSPQPTLGTITQYKASRADPGNARMSLSVRVSSFEFSIAMHEKDICGIEKRKKSDMFWFIEQKEPINADSATPQEARLGPRVCKGGPPCEPAFI